MTELRKVYGIRHKPTGQWMGSQDEIGSEFDMRILYATRKAADAKIRKQIRFYESFNSTAFVNRLKNWKECESVELTLNLPNTGFKSQSRKMRNDDVFEVGRDRGWR